MHGIEPPSAGDYAYAAAQDANKKAQQALELERDNKERIDLLMRRQRHLELLTGHKTAVDAAIQRENEELARTHYPPQEIGGVEIPEGWEPTVEGRNLVFRKKEN